MVEWRVFGRRLSAALMLCAALMMGGVGCAGAEQEKKSHLGQNVKIFHQHLRWARYYEASLFMPADEREVFLGRQEELGEGWRVVEVEIKSLRVITPEKEAEAEVMIAWTRAPDVVVHRDKVIETWKNIDGHWKVVSRRVED